MKAKVVIITLASLLSTNVFALTKTPSIRLACKGSVDKSVELTADIKRNGQGVLKISYGTGDSIAEATRKISLISTPSPGSDNYRFATTDEDQGVTNQDEFAIHIRSQVIHSKTSGRAGNGVNLFIKPAMASHDIAYGLTCLIFQQD